jgi:hypothetical protein
LKPSRPRFRSLVMIASAGWLSVRRTWVSFND